MGEESEHFTGRRVEYEKWAPSSATLLCPMAKVTAEAQTKAIFNHLMIELTINMRRFQALK